MSHPAFTVLCAALIAAVTSASGKGTPRERTWVTAKTFIYCVASVIGGSWVMLAIHG